MRNWQTRGTGKQGLSPAPVAPPFWLVPLLVLALSLSTAIGLFRPYYASAAIGHRAVAGLESSKDFANLRFDDLTYIPRMNAVAAGFAFSDPWTSYNPHFRGWGPFGLIPPLLGGALFYLCNNLFLAMTVWGLINYVLMALLIYGIFRSPPLNFTWPASICLTYLLFNGLWFAALPLQQLSLYWHLLIDGIGSSPGFVQPMAMDRIEAGLFTYLFYFIFLAVYWRFWSRPSRVGAIWMGCAAGLLTYVYFFHYIFAFSLLFSHLLWAAVRRRFEEARWLGVALAVGIMVAVPYLINNTLFLDATYYQRLDYMAGRWPVDDYRYLANFAFPGIFGIIYLALRPPAPLKTILVGVWVNLGLAYFLVLNLRLLLGFSQAADHFWRYSLGIPASLWCLAAAADLLRSRLGAWSGPGRALKLAALLLPWFILARTAFALAGLFHEPDVSQRLSPAQHHLLKKLDALDQILISGEGFLTDDPALNYHIMANLKGARPFLPPGLSPLSLEDITQRYLVTHYLLGGEKVSYPAPIPPEKRGENYLEQTDLNLYLYLKQFRPPYGDRRPEAKIKELYREWPPPWAAEHDMQEALSTVRAVYVEAAQASGARERLSRWFLIEREVPVSGGWTFRVKFRGFKKAG